MPKLAHSLDTGRAVHKGMTYMADRFDEISGGSKRIDICPSGELGANGKPSSCCNSDRSR